MFPELVKPYQMYGSAGLIVPGVNGRDQEYSTKDVQKFLKDFPVPFQTALDGRGRSRKSFLILGLPTIAFSDSAGRRASDLPRPDRSPESRAWHRDRSFAALKDVSSAEAVSSVIRDAGNRRARSD